MRTIKGEIEFQCDKLDITDPCYDSDVWCRKSVSITPGKYLYTVKIKQERKHEVISQLKIRQKKAKGGIRFFRNVGTIGVDAGLAGFFENKPDYDDEDWARVCDVLLATNHPTVLQTSKDDAFGCNGIVVTSGYGDGVYLVREIIGDNETCLGYIIDFE